MLLAFGAVPAQAQCPAIGYSADCSVVIEIRPSGALVFHVNPSIPPYDNIEDTLVGVVNHSGATVFGIALTGNDIFGFDGDGAGDPTGSFWAAGSPFGAYPGGPFGPTGYEGPGTSFTVQDSGHGTVNFTNGLNNNDFIWFSLEGAPSAIRLSQRVTIDPGHGSNCAAVNQLVGTVGVTDYMTPPLGLLREDVLTVSVAATLAGLLGTRGFDVHQTKTDSVSCPTLLERGAIANKARSNILVSIHFDRPRRTVLGIPIGFTGSLGLYNSGKSSAKTLAEFLSTDTSAAIGVNNRGTEVRDDLGVLKATATRMTAAIIEVARLSSPDEDIVHDPLKLRLAAAGILLGIMDFLNQ